MKKPVQEDTKLYSDAMKAPLFFSIVLHAMVLLLFGTGMGLQGGSPGKAEVMYVSLVQVSGPKSKVQDPRSDTQDSRSREEEVSLNSQPSTFNFQLSTLNVGETESTIKEQSSLNAVDEPTTSNQQLTTSITNPPISNFQFPISNLESHNPEPVAITAYAGNSLPAGILGQGSEANAGLIYFPPVATTLPRPPYPLSSRRKGEEGTVTLSFLIYSDGTVGEILVVQSSGYPRLDKAASRSLRSAVFRPASESGLLVTSNRKIAFSFRLED